jgi:Family of unknown function (DUF6166)
MSEVTYTGTRDANGTLEVRKQVDELPPEPLDPRLDLRRHSPTGFEVSYSGSGPRQLALAIIADVLGDEAGLELSQKFKEDVIATLPWEGFKITAAAVEEWAKEIGAKEGW